MYCFVHTLLVLTREGGTSIDKTTRSNYDRSGKPLAPALSSFDLPQNDKKISPQAPE